MARIQFPNLNGLRFFAAFGVFATHVEHAKFLYGLPNIAHDPAILRLGHLCVSLFFVLSGFLITFLLMEEARIFHTVSVRKFYCRRALRIWPLYYIIVVLSFFVLPMFPAFNVPGFPQIWDAQLGQKLALYVGFAPHVAAVWLPVVNYACVLWSIGVEEWFYFIWPWVIKYGKSWEPYFLASVIVIMTIARAMIPSSDKIWWLLYQLRFDCMAIGGIFAILLNFKHGSLAQKILSFAYRPEVQLSNYILLTFAVVQAWTFGAVEQLVYSTMFSVAILNLATNKQSILRLEAPSLRWLGDISYGIYCYNWIAIVCSMLLIKALAITQLTQNLNICLYALSTVLTIIFAGISYEFIERRFLLLKQQRFTQLRTLTPATIYSTYDSSGRVQDPS